MSALARLVAVFAVVTLAGSTGAQSITRITPEAAAPGDLVILDGTGLAGVTAVRFRAAVGGFLGTSTVLVAPLSASPTEVTVLVPNMAAFAPPGATPPGDPHGNVAVLAPGGVSNSTAFFFMEGTFIGETGLAPQTTTLGTGRTQSTGQGKPVVSFDVPAGLPIPGNAGFVMKVENAGPGETAILLVGFPATAPFPMLGDGTFVLDGGLPIGVAVPVTVDANGDAAVPLAMPGPGPFGVTLVNQWAITDPGVGVVISNGLRYGV